MRHTRNLCDEMADFSAPPRDFADEKTTREILAMAPQLTAFEAMLGTFRPTGNTARIAEVRTAILLEQCRLIEEEITPDARRERLVERIQQAEVEEISVSLKQYARGIRVMAMMSGGFVGVVIGVILAFLGLVAATHWLSTPPRTPPESVREIHYYNYLTNDPNGRFSFPGDAKPSP